MSKKKQMGQEDPQPEQSFGESGAQQAFLLELSDALRPLSDPMEIQQVAMRILGEQLKVDRVMYGRVDQGENYVISDNYVRSDFPKLVGRFLVRTFGEVAEWLRKGETVAIHDMNADERLSEATRAAFLQASVYALLGVPLVKDGRWVANFDVHHGTPRRWTDEEIALVQETAERTWSAAERAQTEEALRKSESKFRRLSESGIVGIAFFDISGAITEANDEFLRFLGVTRDELQSEKVRWDVYTVEAWMPRTRQAIEELQATGIISPYEKQIRHSDGSLRWGLFAGALLSDGHSGVSTIVDITERKRAEEELRRSEERLHLIIESAKGYAIFTTDADGIINSWNAGAAQIFGWSEPEILGQKADVTFTPEDRAAGEPEKEFETARAKGLAPDVRWHLRKDGSRVFINGVTHLMSDGQLSGFFKIGRDETEQRQAEEALRESQQQLQVLNETLEQKVQEKTTEVQQLSAELVEATQRERQRISRVLHDDLQQRIYAIQMQMSFLRDGLPKESQTSRKEMSDIEKELAEIVKITRNLSIDLSPPILPGEGLSHAIEWLAIRMREQYGLPVELQGNGSFVVPHEELHVLLFNCVRELLFNVVKHAGASRAVVALAWLDTGLRIEVRDDGKGFPVHTPEDDLPRSLGLPTIRHQLSLFGGSMEINAEPGAGTQVILIVPVPETSQGISSPADIV